MNPQTVVENDGRPLTSQIWKAYFCSNKNIAKVWTWLGCAGCVNMQARQIGLSVVNTVKPGLT